MEDFDLNPGEAEERGEVRRATKEYLRRFAWLQRFSDEDLEDISLCQMKGPLHVGETYFDLSHPELGSFVAEQEEIVPEGSCYVAKSEVRPHAWEDLTKPMP